MHLVLDHDLQTKRSVIELGAPIWQTAQVTEKSRSKCFIRTPPEARREHQMFAAMGRRWLGYLAGNEVFQLLDIRCEPEDSFPGLLSAWRFC